MSHTPGPWELWTSCSWRRFRSRDGEAVCEPVTQPDGHPDLFFRNGGPDGPDARLIAAAPDLLEVSEAIEGALRMPGVTAAEVLDENSSIRGALRDAIRKARGAA